MFEYWNWYKVGNRYLYIDKINNKIAQGYEFMKWGNGHSPYNI
jgi:hypothetical protein